MAFDFQGWLRQPSTITGIAGFATAIITGVAHYFAGDATLDVVVGSVTFSAVHLVINDNSQAAADAQALAIDLTKGVANHTLETTIPQILRDGIKLVGDIRSPASPPPGTVSGSSIGAGVGTAAALLVVTWLVTACSASAVPKGQLYCAKLQGVEPLVVALADEAGAPVTVTGMTKAFVDGACGMIDAIPVMPPANPAAAPAVSVKLPTGVSA